MADQLLEHSDAVVARYMNRVLELPLSSRLSIEQPFWSGKRRGSWVSFLWLPYLDPTSALWSWGAIRVASVAATREDRQAFALFWDQLKRRHWTLTGRRHIAWGLLAVRSRRSDPAWAIRRYHPMDDVIPTQSIGWDDRAST